MAYTGRTPAAAPLTSGDIPDGSVTPDDLSTGAPSWDTNGKVTTGDGLTVGRGAGNVSTNTAVGASALAVNTSGSANTSFGASTLQSNTTGSGNTGVGYNAFALNTTGNYNVGMGENALFFNTSGSNNTSIGYQSLQSNTTASNNTAVGYQALYDNTTGYDNTAVGNCLYNNTEGYRNTAMGRYALSANTTGDDNVSIGNSSLGNSTTASFNTSVGYASLNQLTTGQINTALGWNAGSAITTGSKNTILGAYNGNQGGLDIRTSSNNIVLSDGDGNPRVIIDSDGRVLVHKTTDSGGPSFGGGNVQTVANDGRNGFTVDDIDNGYVALGTDSLGDNAYYAGYFARNGSVVGSILCSGSSTSYVTSSDYRLKEDWQPMSGATERLKQLKPVNFAWKADGIRVDGFLAHEAAEVVPEAVHGEKDAVDEEGNPIYQGIDQSKLVPLLVATIQELEARIAALEATP